MWQVKLKLYGCQFQFCRHYFPLCATHSFQINQVEISKIPSECCNRCECLIARRRQHVNNMARTCNAITPAPRKIMNEICFEKNSLRSRQPSVWTNLSAGLVGVSKSFPQLGRCVVLERQQDRGTLLTQYCTLLF